MTRLLYILFLVLAAACSGNDSDGAGGAGGAGGMGGQGGAGGAEPDCTSNEDCDDEQECTADVCTPEGVCESTTSEDETECSLGLCVSGVCEPVESAFPCTEEGIRQAVTAGGGPYGFLCDGAQTVTTAAEIVIDTDVILDGLGILTVDADGQHRPLSVLENVTAELRRLTVTGGSTPDLDGGGIFNDGTLTLIDTTVSNSTAPRFGGGVANSGALTMMRCSITDNTAGEGGGGISHVGGALSMVDTTVSSNTAGGDGGQGNGGGVFNQGGITLTGCTVSGNEATGDGGGLAVANSATLLNTTISGNTAGQNGGGIRNNSALLITHCTFSGNSAAAGDAISNGGAVNPITASIIDGQCASDMGAFWTYDDYNLESPGDTCGFDEPNDQVDVSPQSLGLGALADNGGPTQTHALDPASVAVDVIDEAMCEADADQRGVARPQGAACDVGAFELEP